MDKVYWIIGGETETHEPDWMSNTQEELEI